MPLRIPAVAIRNFIHSCFHKFPNSNLLAFRNSKMPKATRRYKGLRICRWCQRKIVQDPRRLFFGSGTKSAACKHLEKFTGIDASKDPEYFPGALCGDCVRGCLRGTLKRRSGDWDVSTPEKERKVKELLEYIQRTPIKVLEKEEREREEMEAQNAMYESGEDPPGTVVITKSEDASKYVISEDGEMILRNIVNLNSMDENAVIENNPIERYFVRGKAKMLQHLTLEAGGKVLKINGQYVLVEEEIEVFNLNEIVEGEDAGIEVEASGNDSFKCKICSEKMPPEYLASHLTTKTNFDKFFCCFCYDYFDTIEEKNQHCSRHNPEQKRCTYCGLIFLSDVELQTHLSSTHPRKYHGRFHCHRCGTDRFTCSAQLLRHMKENWDVCVNICKICKREYVDVSKFNVHLRKHWLKECSCGKHTDSPTEYYRHLLQNPETCLNSRLVKSNQTIRAPDADGLYRCSFCNASFESLKLLNPHVAQHVELEPSFACEKCGKKFNTSIRLKRHSITHEFSRCKKCNQEFRSHYLHRHYCAADPELAERRRLKAAEDWQRRMQRRKAGISSAKCEVCQQVFASGFQLTKHKQERILGNDMGYKCCECEVVLEAESFEAHLLEHVRNVKNEWVDGDAKVIPTG